MSPAMANNIRDGIREGTGQRSEADITTPLEPHTSGQHALDLLGRVFELLYRTGAEPTVLAILRMPTPRASSSFAFASFSASASGRPRLRQIPLQRAT